MEFLVTGFDFSGPGRSITFGVKHADSEESCAQKLGLKALFNDRGGVTHYLHPKKPLVQVQLQEIWEINSF